MAYVSGFDTDIFISYAHQDNSVDWITEFHTRLGDRFGELLGFGQKVAIWRDPNLSPASVVTEEILARLSKTAVLLTIATPSSMESPNCLDERSKFEFYAEQNGGVKIGSFARTINVVKTPPRAQKRFPFTTLDADFFERDKQTMMIREFAASGSEFKNQIDALAQRLLEFFDILNERPKADPTDAVFVALTSSDMASTRNKIVQELEALGYCVLPPENFAKIDAPGFREEIEKCLAKSQMTVHCTSDLGGSKPEGEELPLAALQFALACKHKLPRIVWVEPGKQINASFRQLLDEVGQPGTEILANPVQQISELKRLIVTTLGTLRQVPTPSPSKLNIYLLCDASDYPNPFTATGPNVSKQIHEFLTGKGYNVWLPLLETKNEQDRTNDHQETLEISDAVLVLWGNTDETWFRKRARELASIQSRRAHRPMRVRALLLASPPANKDQYRGFLDVAICLFDGFRPETFAPLEQLLNRA
jgi:hypothetical protein